MSLSAPDFPGPSGPMASDPESVYYVNGRFVPVSGAVISVHDLAVARGYAVFESLRTYGGHPFRLPDHLRRLRQSAGSISVPLPWSDQALTELVRQTLGRNSYPESVVRIMITAGPSRDLFHPDGEPGLIVMVRPLRAYPPDYIRLGVAVATVEIERFLPLAKTTLYLPGMLAMNQARAQDPEVVEALYVDPDGRVSEGVTSNIFAFVGETLVTPGEGILMGVTRQVVLELAEGRFPVEVRPLLRDEIFSAKEVFLTGSVKQVLPVRSIDRRTVGEGRPGPSTRALMAAYEDHTTQFARNSGQVSG